MELKDLVIGISSLMSVTGWEGYDNARLGELVGGGFDEFFEDEVGNRYFVKRSGRKNAPKILLDAHMDEIGMFVTEIKDGGFLGVVNVGGLDTRILQAADVVIYGEKVIRGVVASTPPHLQKPGESKLLKEISELLIDTGYTKEELEGIVRIGTPVGFLPKYTSLLDSQIAGKGFDDKSCAACAIYGVAKTPKDALAGDVYIQLSAHEETDRLGGAAAGAFNIAPDYAMVIDVNFGRSPDAPKADTLIMGGGPSLTLGPVTDKKLTKMTAELAAANEIKIQYSVCPAGTGTNSPAIAMSRDGIPVVDVGLPLKSMHTYNEVIKLEDCVMLADLVSAFVSSDGIAREFSARPNDVKEG